MRLTPAFAVLVVFALAGTLAAKDDLESGAKDGASGNTEYLSFAVPAHPPIWGEFHPGASEAFYLELGDETSGYGKVVFQQDDAAKGVVSCFLPDAPRADRIFAMTMKELTTQPDYFRRGFTWTLKVDDFSALGTRLFGPETKPSREVTATLKPCTGAKVDCFLPQAHLYKRDMIGDNQIHDYLWDQDHESRRDLAPESGFPKRIVADINRAFYWDIGDPQNGAGTMTVYPLDDGSGSLGCFVARQIDPAKGGFSGVYISNKTSTTLDDLSVLGAFESIDAQTKARISDCTWIPSTVVSSDQIKTLAKGWLWRVGDSAGKARGDGKRTTGPKPCSSRSDSLCDLSKATLHHCYYRLDLDLPLCRIEIEPKILLPNQFARDASDAFFVEVGDHVKGKVFFQKDERNAAIVTCFAPDGHSLNPVNTTVHLTGSSALDSNFDSDIDLTASYHSLPNGRERQDCSLSAYTELAWKGLLSAEWENMTWNVTLSADDQPRISTVGKSSPRADCAKASDGGCQLLDFVGCVTKDAYSDDHDSNHCTFEGKAAGPAST